MLDKFKNLKEVIENRKKQLLKELDEIENELILYDKTKELIDKYKNICIEEKDEFYNWKKDHCEPRIPEKKPETTIRKKWEYKDIEKLTKMYKDKVKIKEIAIKLDRSLGSTNQKIIDLKSHNLL